LSIWSNTELTLIDNFWNSEKDFTGIFFFNSLIIWYITRARVFFTRIT
jgi:hypothetical protein